MDDRRHSTVKPSGIPRFSRLPVPNSANNTSSASSGIPVSSVPKAPTIRPSASRDSLSGLSHLQNPKLRSTPSRDQLATPASVRRNGIPQRPLSGTPPARTGSQPSPQAHGRTVSNHSPNLSKQNESFPINPITTPAQFKKSLTLNRRPSKNFAHSGITAGQTEEGGEYTLREEIEDDSAPSTIKAKPFRPRPSLSERTIETLSQLPSSPALKGKSSSFFDPDASRRPPSRPGSRPGSSYQSEGSSRPPSRPHSRSLSRPSSSSGQEDMSMNFRASTNTFRAPLSTIEGTPVRGRGANPKTLKTPSSRTSLGGNMYSNSTFATPKVPIRSRTPSPAKRPVETPTLKYAAKTVASRPLKPRASLNGLFKKPSIAALDQASKVQVPRKTSLASQRSSTSAGTDPSSASVASTAITNDSGDAASPSAMRNSSAVLRDQIAKAKAAKRAASRQVSSSLSPTEAEVPVIPTDTTFDFGLSQDPFGQHRDEGSSTKMVQARVQAARTSGRLNIAALGLREIPADVMNIYDLTSIGKSDGSWAESVDLTRFVAADNELEMIHDSIFPDEEAHTLAEEEDGRGNIFGGLETLDLHGNMLICLPMGLRRLHQLTSLNLANNRITNNALEVISQMTTLRDLKLGGNLFYGPLDPCFAKLENLEIADLHGNNISALPLNVQNMSKLRILNLSENNFEDLLFEPLSALPLIELHIRKNKLSGVLIEDAVDALPTLQNLDVSSNQITQLVSASRSNKIELPALQQLGLSTNRLQVLPDVGGWQNLSTVIADENSIGSIPDGFTSLANLKHADFSSNDIRTIPAEIARMDNLITLRLSGNPLRDKKFSTATLDEVKDVLLTRLEPEPADNTPLVTHAYTIDFAVPHEIHGSGQEDDSRSDMDDFATPPTSAPHSPARSRAHTLSNATWPVKPGGVLDRSETQSSSLHPVVCSQIAADNKIYEVFLQRNLFTAFPDALSFFASTLRILCLSHNQLIGESYLGVTNGVELDLPALKELNLASNHITGLGPLVSHLHAESLQKLDVSFNRISALPPGAQLKNAFPSLDILIASDNHLADFEAEQIKGFRIVDAHNNEIQRLDPKIGLLGGTGGLERLEVSGNRFRVPRFSVLQCGTEATLRWLRGRIPAGELSEWRAANKRVDDDEEDELD